MDRFGSSKLRIVWTCVFLLLAGLVLGGVQGFAGDGSQLQVFGSAIPLGVVSDDPKAWTEDILGRGILGVVPGVILLGGFWPLGEWLASGAKGERFRGLLLGTPLAFLHGLFLAQVAILPFLAASARLLGNPLSPKILLADANATVLGLQLLLWATAAGAVLRSCRGLGILVAFALQEIGRVLSWGGEWLGDLDFPAKAVKAMKIGGMALPNTQLPTDPMGLKALALGLGAPLVLTGLLLLIPGGAPKRSKA